MANPPWNTNSSQSWLKKTTSPGILGFYTHCEVTTVLGFSDESPQVPVNIFTTIVLEDAQVAMDQGPSFLNAERIELKTLKGWKFGVYRHSASLKELLVAIENFSGTTEWKLGEAALSLGNMAAVAPQFVPSNGTESVPLNQLLKNNFWNGAYILEWFDGTKQSLAPFQENPPRLQELSAKVQQYIPLGLASVSDRLGNLLVQLPVTVLMSDFRQVRDSGDFTVEVAWHPRATPRPLRATCEMQFDGVFCGYGQAEVQATKTNLPTYDSSQLNRQLIWDEQNGLILAAQAPVAYIRQLSAAIHVGDPEPRVFSVDGTDEPIRVYLRHSPHVTNLGDANHYPHREWVRRRMYEAEISRLTQERRFVQYKPQPGQDGENSKALDDVRFLINRYGARGVWLWDPYLTSTDILSTLFYCQHSGADLRAITAAEEIADNPCRDSSLGDRISLFISAQKTALDDARSNYRGLQLEFRVRRGNAGWKFHDRFLIFPDVDEQRQTLAWSLGTSVNSLGKQHHILQRVDNGRLIMDAFLDLWNQLDQPEHLIWRK